MEERVFVIAKDQKIFLFKFRGTSSISALDGLFVNERVFYGKNGVILNKMMSFEEAGIKDNDVISVFSDNPSETVERRGGSLPIDTSNENIMNLIFRDKTFPEFDRLRDIRLQNMSRKKFIHLLSSTQRHQSNELFSSKSHIYDLCHIHEPSTAPSQFCGKERFYNIISFYKIK